MCVINLIICIESLSKLIFYFLLKYYFLRIYPITIEIMSIILFHVFLFFNIFLNILQLYIIDFACHFIISIKIVNLCWRCRRFWKNSYLTHLIENSLFRVWAYFYVSNGYGLVSRLVSTCIRDYYKSAQVYISHSILSIPGWEILPQLHFR